MITKEKCLSVSYQYKLNNNILMITNVNQININLESAQSDPAPDIQDRV